MINVRLVLYVFLIALLLIGNTKLPYFREFKEPTMFHGFGVVIMAIAGIFFNRGAKSFVRAIAYSCASFFLGSLGLIIYDINFFDKNSHGMAPFEIIFAVIGGGIIASVGYVMGGRTKN